jgi:hypothetical protein
MDAAVSTRARQKARRRIKAAAAARQRRYRHRQRCGDVTALVTFSQAETAKLNRLGCLTLARLEDRAAVADAVHLLLASIQEDKP